MLETSLETKDLETGPAEASNPFNVPRLRGETLLHKQFELRPEMGSDHPLPQWFPQLPPALVETGAMSPQ
jgi:hypothetical protein